MSMVRKVKTESFGLVDIGLTSSRRKFGEDEDGGVKLGISEDVGTSRAEKRVKATLTREVFTPHDAGLVVGVEKRGSRRGIRGGSNSRGGSGDMSKLVEKSAPLVNLSPITGIPPSNMPPANFVSVSTVNEVVMAEKRASETQKGSRETIMAWRAAVEETTMEAPPLMFERAAVEETTMEAPPLMFDEIEEQPLASMHKAIPSTPSEINISEAEEEDEASMSRVRDVRAIEDAALETTKDTKELILKSDLDKKSSSTKQGVNSGSVSTTPVTVKTRAYQQEMFEESLKRNIIVCVGAIFSLLCRGALANIIPLCHSKGPGVGRHMCIDHLSPCTRPISRN